MNYRSLPLLPFVIASIGFSETLPSAFAAETLPGPADVGRIRPEENMSVPDRSQDQEITIPAVPPSAPIPEAAKTIHFTLKEVSIEGATAFTPEQLADLYAPYIGKEVTLDTAWMIAAAITDRYRKAGYFLSRVYVPQQRIKDGRVTINIIEGYVGKVELPEELNQHSIVRGYTDRLTALKPVTAEAVESFLLRMNDLPGLSFRAVLSPLADKGEEEAAVQLTLVPAPKDGKGSITFDNFSSRYLGPNELSASYATSLLPLQQTAVSGLSSLPVDKLRYGTLDHMVMIAPDMSVEVGGGVTKAYPGYTLEPLDINSLATSASVALNYQLLRQRQENLALKLMLDGRDVTSDILDTPLTRDRIRALRAGATYDGSDSWQGYNIASVTLSQGIDGLGASEKEDAYVSRAGALPNFEKAELSLSRLQGITTDWSVFAASSGQWASGVLYSSEEFGYGGQAFGRAYDTSAITGDKGMAGSLELRYGGLGDWQQVTLQPYTFYDIGQVWNESTGQPKRESGASAGFGMRFTTEWHQSANIGVAWPLTRDITAPIYGEGSRGPRILLQVSQAF